MTGFLSFISAPRYHMVRNRQLWLRLLMVVGVLLFSAALAYWGSQSQHKLLMMLLAGTGATLTFLRWPALGLIMLTVGGMLIPYVGPAGLNASLGLAALLLVLWIAEMVIVQRQVKLMSSRTLWALFALVVVACLSFIVGQFSWFTFARNAPLDAQLGGLAIFVLSAGTFFLVAHQVKDLRWLQVIVWIFLAFGTLFLAGRALPAFRPLTMGLIQPSAIGGVFYAWFPALALGQALFNRDLRPVWRLVLVILVALCLYVGYFLFFNWKSGWMPAFAAVATIVYLRSWRFGLALGLLAVIPALQLLPDFLASDDYSISTRFDAWLILAEIIKVNPILGLGFANYYWYTPLFRIRGWAVTFNSHNNYVDIVAQTGLLGLACFLWFFWEVGRLGWQLRARVSDGFARAYVNGALGGLVATLVAAMLGDWVLSFVYNVGLAGFRTGVLAWIFLGGLVAIQNMYRTGNEQLPT